MGNVTDHVLRYVSEQLPTARSKQINNKREVKTAKSVMIIVFLFVLSWIPLYTLNAVMFFCSDCNISSHLFNFSIILSHLNSAWNPLLYAWGLKGFQKAIMRILCPWKVVANDRSLNESRRASNVTRLATFSTCNNGNLYS